MADEDEDGDFQKFAPPVKTRPGGRCSRNFRHRHSLSGAGLLNRQPGRSKGFFDWQRGRGKGFRSSYGGYRENFCVSGNSEGFWSASGEEPANGHFNMDPQHHYNNEGFSQTHMRDQLHPNDRVQGRGRGRQIQNFSSDGFHGHGRGKSHVHGHGRIRNHSFGRGCHHQDVPGNEDAGNSLCNGDGSKLCPDWGGKQTFAYGRGKMRGRGRFFRGNLKRMGGSFGNITVTQCIDSNRGNTNAAPSADVHTNSLFECNGDGIGSKVCRRGSSLATKVDGSTSLDRQKLEKQEASPSSQRPLASKCASPLPVPLKGKSQKEGTLLQEEDATVAFDPRHQERAFISCIGGNNKKRRRSSAVRDFPEGHGKLHSSVVTKVKTRSKDSKVLARDSVATNSIGEVGSLSNLKVTTQNFNNSNILDVPVEFVHVDPEVIAEDCTKTHFIEEVGPAELVPSGFKATTENASKHTLSEGDAPTKLVQVSHEINIEICSKATSSGDDGHAEQVLASREANYEKCSNTISCEEDALVELVQAGREVNFEAITNQVDKDHCAEGTRSDLEVSNKERNEKLGTSSQISSNGHGAPHSTSDLALENLHMKLPPKGPAAPEMHLHTSSQGDSHSILKDKSRKPLMNRRAETPSANGPLRRKSRHNKADRLAAESTDTLTGLHNRGHVSKKLKVHDSSEITANTGALIPYQSSNNGDSMRNKDPGRRLVRKGNTRVKLFQTSRSLDSLMLNDPAKVLCLEATEGVSARSLVKRTLHEFESVRKALVKSQDAVRRADLDAASLLKEKGKWRNCEEKIVGEVPGVEVGDQFSFRMEMLIIGLHRQVQSGIDYIPGAKRNSGSPLATSIVASGGYEDDKDDGNTLIYSGQGGNNNKGNKKQESNQELVRGNLAMSNSMKEKTPVRVIRGTSDLASPSSKVYTYDGLYDVVDLTFECGAAGYRVYHFTLTRRSGQPQVGLSFLSNLKKKGLARPYLLLSDISRGQERLPVCVVNEVDDETAPLHFTYIPSIKYPVWYTPLLPQACNCVGGCDEETCSCAIKNEGEFPYNEKGYIIQDKKVVYECGNLCSCSSSCQNRVSQKGLRYRLEIFKTKNRGWGVRSMDSIQPGGFICEYTGELLSDAEAEQKIENDEYLFDLGNECNPSTDQSNVDKNGSTAIVPVVEDVGYTIDAKDLGNVARFINHSCSPNLYAQNVLYDSDDLRFPHVMLFAMENIPPMRELTYDYNYTIDRVRDAYGNVKTKACYCGAQDCQGRLY